MSESMVERVASAMLQKAFRNPECIDWDRGTVNFMPLARAAIAAMREPTDDYCRAIVRVLGCYPDKQHVDVVRMVHQQWIDEALK